MIGSVPGYLAIHIYLNFVIYSGLPHTSLGGVSAIFHTVVAITTEKLSGFLLFTGVFLSLLKLASREYGVPWRSILVAIALASLMIRGEGFRSLPYYYSALALPLVFLGETGTVKTRYWLIVGAFLFFCFFKLSLLVPGDHEILERARIPQETEFSKLVKRLTHPDDRIISYSFENFEYLAADRLPASGNIYYLPQQEIYRHNPKFGVTVDACGDISRNRPKIMLIDQWNAWGRFRWESYGKCIQEIMDRDYVQLSDRPYHVRRDMLESVMQIEYSADVPRPSLQEVMAKSDPAQ